MRRATSPFIDYARAVVSSILNCSTLAVMASTPRDGVAFLFHWVRGGWPRFIRIPMAELINIS